jgi:hypothetical protein
MTRSKSFENSHTNGIEKLNVALALPVFDSRSTLIPFGFSLLVGDEQAVASMVRRSKGRTCSRHAYTGRASATRKWANLLIESRSSKNVRHGMKLDTVV